jgi:hypothetical protein
MMNGEGCERRLTWLNLRRKTKKMRNVYNILVGMPQGKAIGRS